MDAALHRVQGIPIGIGADGGFFHDSSGRPLLQGWHCGSLFVFFINALVFRAIRSKEQAAAFISTNLWRSLAIGTRARAGLRLSHASLGGWHWLRSEERKCM